MLTPIRRIHNALEDSGPFAPTAQTIEVAAGQATNAGPSVVPPVPAGNISRYSSNWSSVTDNSFILRIAFEGYKIQLLKQPIQSDPVITDPKSFDKRLALQEQITKHLASGAISEVPCADNQFISRVFTVPKRTGGNRLVIDLSSLNNFVVKVHFRMEDLNTIKSFLAPNDYMVSIDLADAFFSVPLHPDSKPLTTFQFDGKRYSYNVLPFGLSSSPRIFSKMLKPVITSLRCQGIKISAFLDDLFICGSNPELVSTNARITLDTLQRLGFNPNFAKSNLFPSQEIEHLGYIWNSTTMSLSLPLSKIIKTRLMANCIKVSNFLTLRDVAQFIGVLVSHCNGYPHAPLHYRRLQLQYNSCVHLTAVRRTSLFLTQMLLCYRC